MLGKILLAVYAACMGLEVVCAVLFFMDGFYIMVLLFLVFAGAFGWLFFDTLNDMIEEGK